MKEGGKRIRRTVLPGVSASICLPELLRALSCPTSERQFHGYQTPPFHSHRLAGLRSVLARSIDRSIARHKFIEAVKPTAINASRFFTLMGLLFRPPSDRVFFLPDSTVINRTRTRINDSNHTHLTLADLARVSGFRGDHCEENIDDCPGNLCQNGATCVDRVNEYSCLCPPAFTGTQCELDVDECSVRPSLCHNGATCTNSHGSYSCICVNGWTGPDCSVNIDDCAGAACFNGATCIDRVGSFYCQCTYGKTGK